MTPATAPATRLPDSKPIGMHFQSVNALVAFACILVSSIMCASYVCFRIGFTDMYIYETVKSLALAIALISSPSLVRAALKKNSLMIDGLVIAMTLACLVALGSLSLGNFGLIALCVYAAIALGATIHQLPALRKEQWLIVLGGTIIVGLWISAYVFGFQAHDPLTLELRPAHAGGADALFHVALVQNLNTYGVISTGLNGVPVLPYHTASHWIYLRLANLLNESPINFYLLTFPVVIAPLFLMAFFTAINDLRGVIGTRWSHNEFCSPYFWLGIFVVLVGCIPPEVRKISAGLAWGQPFASESHTTGVLFFFLGLSIVLFLQNASKYSVWLIPVFLPAWLMLLTGTKVSWLLVGTLALGILLLRERTFRSLPFAIAIPLAVAGAYYVNLLSKASDCQGGVKLSVGDSFKNFAVPGHNWEFIAFYFLPIWVLVGVTVAHFGYRSLLSWKPNSVPAHLILAMWISLFAFANLVELEGAAAHYFLDPLRWMSIGLLCALMPLSLWQGLSNRKRTVLAVSAVLLVTYNISSELNNAVARNLDERLKIANLSDRGTDSNSGGNNLINGPQAALNQNPTYQFMQHLSTLQQVPVGERRNTLLFIPQSCVPFWTMSEDKYGPFTASALSGMAMLDGMPPADRTPRAYGYDDYAKRNSEPQQSDPAANLQRAQAMGFKNIRVLDWKAGAVVDQVYGALPQ